MAKSRMLTEDEIETRLLEDEDVNALYVWVAHLMATDGDASAAWKDLREKMEARREYYSTMLFEFEEDYDQEAS